MGVGRTGDAVAEFFDELGKRGHEPLLTKGNGTLRFDVSDGKRTERWHVTVKKGDIAVSRRNVQADCVVRGDRALMGAITRGETNATAALLRGALDIEGTVELLVLFQRLFPGPPKGRKQS